MKSSDDDFCIVGKGTTLEKWDGVEFPLQSPEEKVSLHTWIDHSDILPIRYQQGEVWFNRKVPRARSNDFCAVVMWSIWGGLRDNPESLHAVEKQWEALRKRVEEKGMTWELSKFHSDAPEYYELENNMRPVRTVIAVIRK